MNFFSKILLVFVIVVGGFSCKKENNTDTVPATTVDITLYTNNPSYVSISTVGGWMYITGGVRGIIVYRYSSNEFKAYDRNCTYQSSSACATVSVDPSNLFASDTCCKSKFLLVDGSIAQGPAGIPLKTYNTIYDGNVLRIYN